MVKAEPDYEHVRRCLKGEVTHTPAFLSVANNGGLTANDAPPAERDGNSGRAPATEEGSHKLARADSRVSADDAPGAMTPASMHSGWQRGSPAWLYRPGAVGPQWH